jgi:hypothetical protein
MNLASMALSVLLVYRVISNGWLSHTDSITDDWLPSKTFLSKLPFVIFI